MEQYLTLLSAAWGKFILPLLEFIIGLGVIVFVHELGHFLVAKWVGIKVEQFAFGFGKRLFGVKVGETDYRVNLVPLGGYVKMLGQEDFKPLKEGDKPDPRAFDQKSVGARFAVISAGVIMNVILAGVLFVIVAMAGLDVPAPVIASVSPGTPAYKAVVQWEGPAPTTAPATAPAAAPAAIAATTASAATGPAAPLLGPVAAPPYDPWSNHLQAGDKILHIDGDNIILWLNGGQVQTMQELVLTSALSSEGKFYDFTIERKVDGVTRTGKAHNVGVTNDGEKPIFGIGSQSATPVIAKGDDSIDMSPFQADDRILKINNFPIVNAWDIPRAEDTLDGGPFTVTVQRGPETKVFQFQPGLRGVDDYIYKPDGSSLRCLTVKLNRKDKVITSRIVQPDQGPELTFNEDELDSSAVNFLGMVPRVKVMMVLSGSPADQKDLKPGDIVVAYGQKNNPTRKQLMEISKDKFEKGVPAEIEILRGSEILTKPITPKSREDTPELGIQAGGDWGNLVVAGPIAGSPAAKAGIENGATITQVNGLAVHTWPQLYLALRQEMGKELKITFLPVRADPASAAKTVSLGKLTPAMFDPLAYRFSGLNSALPFKPLVVPIHYTNPLAAVEWGGKQTVTWILGTYVSIRSMIMGTVSPKSASGPLGLGAAAVKIAQDGFIKFIDFFAIISAAIAVFNFLPLPVMDGGYAVFLIVEKIRGRPLSVHLTNIIQMTGLVLLLGLFLVITGNDIYKMIHGSWM